MLHAEEALDAIDVRRVAQMRLLALEPTVNHAGRNLQLPGQALDRKVFERRPVTLLQV